MADVDSEAFRDFVRQAREFLQVDADKSWLQEVWLGADSDLNRAINHVMDTPPGQVRKTGQGAYSQPSSPSRFTKDEFDSGKKKKSKHKKYHGSDYEGYGDEKSVKKAKKAAKRNAAAAAFAQQGGGPNFPTPQFNGGPSQNPMANVGNGPAGMYGVLNQQGNFSGGSMPGSSPPPVPSASPGRDGNHPAAMTAMQTAVGQGIQALQSQLIVLMQQTMNSTPTSNAVAAQQHTLLASMQTQVNSISNSLTASTKLPYPQQQNSLDTISKQIQAVQLQMLLLQQQHQLQSDLFEDDSDDDDWWCAPTRNPQKNTSPPQTANGFTQHINSGVIGQPPPTWAGHPAPLTRTLSFGAQGMNSAPQLNGNNQPPQFQQQMPPPPSQQHFQQQPPQQFTPPQMSAFPPTTASYTHNAPPPPQQNFGGMPMGSVPNLSSMPPQGQWAPQQQFQPPPGTAPQPMHWGAPQQFPPPNTYPSPTPNPFTG